MNMMQSIRILLALVIAFASSVAADEVTYLHADLLGSPIAATDENGTLLWEERYEPYGERYYEPSAASENKRSFTGHAEDSGGLVYAGARYYNPEIGRFYSPDPARLTIDSSAFVSSRYAYGNLNPYGFVDPDGRDNIAVAVDTQMSVSGNVGHQNGAYRTYRFDVYKTPNWMSPNAQARSYRFVGELVGSFQLTFEARMVNTDNRGSIQGDQAKIAEVTVVEGGKHAIRITDVGKSSEDILTQFIDGLGIVRTGVRAHRGGPDSSTGCPTLCTQFDKPGGEQHLKDQMPALKTEDERTFIVIPPLVTPNP